MGGKYMKKIYTLGVILMVLLSMTMSATALESKTTTRQNSDSASAFWSDGTNSTSLFVSETNDDTFIYVYKCESFICDFGSTVENLNVLKINGNLNSATLSPVTVTTLFFGPLTIEAKWEGVGDVTKSSSQSMLKFGDFTVKFSSDSAFRDATATGSINGNDLGTSNSASLSNDKSVTMTTEK
jgi:hypothetical protein